MQADHLVQLKADRRQVFGSVQQGDSLNQLHLQISRAAPFTLLRRGSFLIGRRL